MNKRMGSRDKSGREKQKDLLEAKKDFQRMEKEIMPFVKHRKFKVYSTDGKWRETSSLYSAI